MSEAKTYRIDWQPAPFGFVEVEGRPVKFKGFERFEFFVHQQPDGVTFTVSERNTGGSIMGDAIAFDAETAIRRARRNLKKAGPDVFGRMVEAAIRDHGHIDGRCVPRCGDFDRDYFAEAKAETDVAS